MGIEGLPLKILEFFARDYPTNNLEMLGEPLGFAIPPERDRDKRNESSPRGCEAKRVDKDRPSDHPKFLEWKEDRSPR